MNKTTIAVHLQFKWSLCLDGEDRGDDRLGVAGSLRMYFVLMAPLRRVLDSHGEAYYQLFLRVILLYFSSHFLSYIASPAA